MKFILLSLFVCALATTGFSSPINQIDAYEHDADHVVGLLDRLITDLETIESGLRSDRKLIEAVRIRVFIGVVKVARRRTTDDNADRETVKRILERGEKITKKYEEYLNEQQVIAFNETEDDQELQNLAMKLEKIEAGLTRDGKKLEAFGVRVFKKIVIALKNNKHDTDFYRNAVKAALKNGEKVVEKYAHYLDDEDLFYLASETEESDEFFAADTEDRSAELADLISNLEKIESGLRKDRRIIEAVAIRVFKRIVIALKDSPLDNEFHRKTVDAALKRGEHLVEKYSEYLDENFLVAFEEENPDDNLDDDEDEKLPGEGDDDDDDKDDDKPDDKKENERLLDRIRKRLQDLRDRLIKRRNSRRARIISRFIRACDILMDRLKNRHLDQGRLHEFLKRAKEILERFEKDLKKF